MTRPHPRPQRQHLQHDRPRHTYNDLGARIVAPESDLNLRLTIILDDATTTQVSIDTSTPGEHTILYTVTSPTTGFIGSALRTVIISPAEQPAEPLRTTIHLTQRPSTTTPL